MSSSVQSSEPVGGLDPDVGSVDPAAKPVRRSFTAEYRARVVAEYAAAPHGEKAGVLRREGLYQSQVREWTDARDAVVRKGRLGSVSQPASSSFAIASAQGRGAPPPGSRSSRTAPSRAPRPWDRAPCGSIATG